VVAPAAAPAVLDDPVVPVGGINTLTGLLRALDTIANSLQKGGREGNNQRG